MIAPIAEHMPKSPNNNNKGLTDPVRMLVSEANWSKIHFTLETTINKREIERERERVREIERA